MLDKVYDLSFSGSYKIYGSLLTVLIGINCVPVRAVMLNNQLKKVIWLQESPVFQFLPVSCNQ